MCHSESRQRRDEESKYETLRFAQGDTQRVILGIMFKKCCSSTN